MARESVHKADSVSTLLESVQSLISEISPDGELWFRGHARGERWKLVPRVHRDYGRDSEQQLLRRFQKKAPSRYNNCPPVSDYPAWTSLAQHYGLPTRLLDWSGSPLVAAYFASLDCEQNEAGAIWALKAWKMNSLFIPANGSVIYSFRAKECADMIEEGWFGEPLVKYQYVAR